MASSVFIAVATSLSLDAQMPIPQTLRAKLQDAQDATVALRHATYVTMASQHEASLKPFVGWGKGWFGLYNGRVYLFSALHNVDTLNRRDFVGRLRERGITEFSITKDVCSIGGVRLPTRALCDRRRDVVVYPFFDEMCSIKFKPLAIPKGPAELTNTVYWNSPDGITSGEIFRDVAPSINYADGVEVKGPAKPGMSGTPVLNALGDPIGVITRIDSHSSNAIYSPLEYSLGLTKSETAKESRASDGQRLAETHGRLGAIELSNR